MKQISYVIIIALLLITISCGDKFPLGERFYSINISNKLSRPVYFYCDDYGRGEPKCPDTTLPSKKLAIKVKANGDYFHTATQPWEDIINDMPHDTMSVYIFDTDVYEHTDWNEISAKHLVLKRYSIDVEYLKKNNYTITYP